MAKITDIHNPWRDALLPASFRGALFHIETASRENGRAIVLHQFPKKDIPYPEDMGRRAKTFNVRGYCITYPIDTGEPLYSRDYRTARDALIAELEKEGPGSLQLPTMKPIMVVNSSYRWSEEERYGGYCTFDMSFMEYGVPSQTQPSSSAQLNDQANAMKQQVEDNLAKATETLRILNLASTPPGPG